jgi:hypothetical protein
MLQSESLYNIQKQLLLLHQILNAPKMPTYKSYTLTTPILAGIYYAALLFFIVSYGVI